MNITFIEVLAGDVVHTEIIVLIVVVVINDPLKYTKPRETGNLNGAVICRESSSWQWLECIGQCFLCTLGSDEGE